MKITTRTFFLGALLSASTSADILNDLNTTKLFHLTGEKEAITLPFVFSTDITGFSGGIAYIRQGIFQPQTTFIGAIYGGVDQDVVVNGKPDTKNFKGAFVYFDGYRLPHSERLFVSFLGIPSYFPKMTYYFDGSHDSKQSDALTTPGDVDLAALRLEYVLPLGEGIRNPDAMYRFRADGEVISEKHVGGGIPFISGRTTVGVEYFYEYNSFENNTLLNGFNEWQSNGLRFYLKHDNTDFDINPSRGYHFEVKYSRDFGWNDTLQTWDFAEFKYNHYVSLNTFSWTRQNVLATSLWTAYSFSWDKHAPQVIEGIDAHRPPMWDGPRLGGIFRMRGYDTDRFSDKAALYMSAEYRATLAWNPFKREGFLPVAIDWLQIVPFIEVGRVNDTYNTELLEDMHIDGGISFRMMAAKVPVRFDIAVSEESTNMWVMVYHPFDF